MSRKPLEKTLYKIFYTYTSSSPKKKPERRYAGWMFEFDAVKSYRTLSHNPKVSEIEVLKRVTQYIDATKEFMEE